MKGDQFKDHQFKVGDLLYFNTEDEFAVIFDIYTSYRSNTFTEPMIKIFWQREQTTTVYYISTLKFMKDKQQERWIHYPSETK